MSYSSLQLSHQLESKHVLLIGAGEVALTRVKKLIPTGAKITLIGKEINPGIIDNYAGDFYDKTEIDQTNINWKPESQQIHRIITDEFQDNHLKLYAKNQYDSGIALILTCLPDQTLSEHIYALAKQWYGEQQMINVADVPQVCDFYFGANMDLDNGKLQVLVSSNGKSPRLTALVRDHIESCLVELPIGQSIDRLGELRSKIRTISDQFDGEKLSILKYRMKWIKTCTDMFGLQNCHLMDVPKLVELFCTMYTRNMSLEFPAKGHMLSYYRTVPEIAADLKRLIIRE